MMVAKVDYTLSKREGGVQYVRTARQWIKITRFPAKKSWSIARGYKGAVVAHEIETWTFECAKTWDDVVSIAVSILECYE